MPVVVPWKDIPAETLDNLIEEFVTRDGTDYGEQETSLVSRVEQVRRRLRDGSAAVVFDEATETVSVMNGEQLREAGLTDP